MKSNTCNFQIGKNGLTQQSIEALDTMLKTHYQIRISVLLSASKNKEAMISLANSIIKKLKTPCEYRVIGFTIILWRAKKPKK